MPGRVARAGGGGGGTGGSGLGRTRDYCYGLDPVAGHGAVALIAGLLLAVIVPLSVNSDQINTTTVRQSDVQAVAAHWASAAGWSVVGVTPKGDQVLVDATGPDPVPSLGQLRQELDAAGLTGVDVQVHLTVASYQPLPK